MNISKVIAIVINELWPISGGGGKKGGYLFPLVDVSDEAGEAQKAEQAEEFDEAQDLEGAAGARQLEVLARLAHQQEQVVERYAGEEVDEEPGAQVVFGDHFRLQDDLVHVVVLEDACRKDFFFPDQINGHLVCVFFFY